mmetsp:Transcript_48374/g.79688  ORF Transcript_48374/g.79688 Transcript_48374/m.79688 type:complete len:93 (-) Transcript_48374:74-352(-)
MYIAQMFACGNFHLYTKCNSNNIYSFVPLQYVRIDGRSCSALSVHRKTNMCSTTGHQAHESTGRPATKDQAWAGFEHMQLWHISFLFSSVLC